MDDEQPRTQRAWWMFVSAAAYVVVGVVWLLWGEAQHDAARMVMAVLWGGFALYWAVRGVRRVRSRT